MKDIVRLALVLTIIAAGAGLILSMVEAVTRAPIAEQRRLETLKALKAVLPPVDNAPDTDTVTLVTGRDRKGKETARTFYRGAAEWRVGGRRLQSSFHRGLRRRYRHYGGGSARRHGQRHRNSAEQPRPPGWAARLPSPGSRSSSPARVWRTPTGG